MSSLFHGATESPAMGGRKEVLAWVEQRWSRREGDGIWYQNDELLRHEPAHVAHRQPEAEPEEPEEQRVDLLQVISEPTAQKQRRLLEFPSL